MPNMIIRIVLGVLLGLCASLSGAQEIIVSAAGSSSGAFKKIGSSFEAQNPGVTVTLNFAAAGVLLQQIEQGAPVDVFASADQMTMDRAVEQGVMDVQTRANFARNTLVLVVPKGATHKPVELADLQEDVYRYVGLGRPEITPAGNYIKQVLQQAGLWSVLEAKMIFAEHVTQVVQYVARQEVDAGFVFMTDARKNAQTLEVALVVSASGDFVYPIARVKTSDQPQWAEKFIEFVLSEQGQRIMASHGFALP